MLIGQERTHNIVDGYIRHQPSKTSYLQRNELHMKIDEICSNLKTTQPKIILILKITYAFLNEKRLPSFCVKTYKPHKMSRTYLDIIAIIII